MSLGDEHLTRTEGLYRQLAERLRHDIETGRYKPGDPLPSEANLTDHYRVSRQTVRKSIALLQAAGLVEVEHGRGTFIRRPPVKFPFSRYTPTNRSLGRGPFEQTCHDLGVNGYGELVLVEQIPADDEIAAGLAISASSPVVHRRRYMHADSAIIQIQDGYFDLELVAGTPLARPAKLTNGTYAALEEIGHAPATATETLTARMPMYSESAILRLKSGVPVIDIQRATFDGNNRVLEWLRVVAAADRNIFAYEHLPLY